ncbi:TadA family conjugal transfer-associated ATPase [Sinomonas humi]|uniref:TadA family conjugal transfer-associated ATPase n=1 Tax=Sinomonas humi TaxID=1338436 RepID=UPI0009DF7E96|nr:TadA family conjugal transfer-associated ATPase [Sinomonas humi]
MTAVPIVDSKLLDDVRERVLAVPGAVTPARIAAAVHESGRLLGTAGTLAAVDLISAELSGLGPLQNLVKDRAVTDILVNGPEDVWLDRGRGLERAPISFPSEEAVRALAVRLVASGGRRLDDSSPCVDVRVAGGYRVHAVLPPISTGTTLLSVRIRRHRAFDLADLEHAGTIVGEQRSILESMAAGGLSYLVSGATGSGKTTLLSTLLGLAAPTERIVLVEDASELNPAHPHVVGLEARHGNVEGSGKVDLAELVRQALRMRPDRLVVGECRGAEVRELLAALNTGHSGAGTVHANSAEAVAARLVALGALAGLSSEAMTLQAANAFSVVLHLERRDGLRQLATIAVVSEQAGRLLVTPALTRARDAVQVEDGPGWDLLCERLSGASGARP